MTMNSGSGIGDVVFDAVVERIEPYGIWLKFESGRCLTLVPELTWSDHRVSDPNEFAQVGQTMAVKLTKYSPADGHYFGSIREVHPEKDPWFDISDLSIGVVRKAAITNKITKTTGLGHVYIAELRPGVRGHFENGDAELEVADEVTVKIRSVDLHSQKIQLELVEAFSEQKD